jgi:hypothetical protein
MYQDIETVHRQQHRTVLSFNNVGAILCEPARNGGHSRKPAQKEWNRQEMRRRQESKTIQSFAGERCVEADRQFLAKRHDDVTQL